jgi:hypothetical protein
VKKTLLGAALVAAALTPAASASRSQRVKLAVVVLPKSALGAAGRSLAVSPNSGVVSNLGAATSAISGTADTFDKLGRTTGYALTYGDRYSGRAGITEISVGVDRYKTSRGAKRGLAFWRKDDPRITEFEPYGLPVTVKALQAVKVGTRRFAEGTTITVPGAAALDLVDEHFTDGRYELHVDVAAGSLSAAAHLAGKLARALDHRLRLAEAGRLRGKPVKVPPRLEAGPPAGGPDLAPLALTTSDFGGQATIAGQGYQPPGPPSLSEYDSDLEPAAGFVDLSQGIEWYPTANDATVLSRFEGVALSYVYSSGLLTGTPGTFTPVDVGSVGHNAYGAIATVPQTGQPTIYLAIVTLSSSGAADFVLASSQSPLQASDVLDLARTTANRLDAGLAG